MRITHLHVVLRWLHCCQFTRWHYSGIVLHLPNKTDQYEKIWCVITWLHRGHNPDLIMTLFPLSFSPSIKHLSQDRSLKHVKAMQSSQSKSYVVCIVIPSERILWSELQNADRWYCVCKMLEKQNRQKNVQCCFQAWKKYFFFISTLSSSWHTLNNYSSP